MSRMWMFLSNCNHRSGASLILTIYIPIYNKAIILDTHPIFLQPRRYPYLNLLNDKNITSVPRVLGTRARGARNQTNQNLVSLGISIEARYLTF